jgi:hypothetical protein
MPTNRSAQPSAEFPMLLSFSKVIFGTELPFQQLLFMYSKLFDTG